MNHTHIVASFENELSQLRFMTIEMAKIAHKQVDLALAALVNYESENLQKVIDLEPDIDHKEREIEALAMRLLALRNPKAIDFREIVSSLKITGDLERIGDYAASVAKREKILSKESLRDENFINDLKKMGNLVRKNISGMVESIEETSSEIALKVWRSDKEIDDIYANISLDLVTYMKQDPKHIQVGMELLFMVKNMERIGDHATNIAERVFYIATGENMPEVRPRGKKKPLLSKI